MKNRVTAIAATVLVAAGALWTAGCTDGAGGQASPTSSASASRSGPSKTAAANDHVPGHGEPAPDLTVQAGTEDEATTTEPAQSPSAEPEACSSATTETLAAVAGQSGVNGRLAHPIVFSRVNCAGRAAMAYTPVDGVHQPTGVLFVHSGVEWNAVGVGSAMDCVALGAPAEDAAQLEGCR